MSPSVTELWFHGSKISIVISVFLPSYERCDTWKCLDISKHCLTIKYFNTCIYYMAFYGFLNHPYWVRIPLS